VEPAARTAALTDTAEGGTLVDSGSVGVAGDWKSDTCGRGEKRAEKEIPAGDDTMPGAEAGAVTGVGARAGALMPRRLVCCCGTNPV
jgi:hypothetical protein